MMPPNRFVPLGVLARDNGTRAREDASLPARFVGIIQPIAPTELLSARSEKRQRFVVILERCARFSLGPIESRVNEEPGSKGKRLNAVSDHASLFRSLGQQNLEATAPKAKILDALAIAINDEPERSQFFELACCLEQALP